MGMFDDLVIDKVHLPKELKDYEEGWQTKSLDCYLNKISINQNGILFESKFGENGVEIGKLPIYHIGEIRFYQEINKKWHEFIGFFDDGIMFKLIQISPPIKDEEIYSQTYVSIKEIEDLFFEMGDDFNTWDEKEKGQYPIQRTLDAMKNFIEYKKRISNGE